MREHIISGYYREYSRARSHHVIGQPTSDGEFRETGMPQFESTPKGKSYANRVVAGMAGLGIREVFEVRELQVGERYLRRVELTDRKIIYRPAYHGIDDGKHGAPDTTKSVELGGSWSKSEPID